MKRTPIKRRTAMPKREKPIQKRSRPRKPSLFMRVKGLLFGGVRGSETSRRGVEVYGDYHEWIKTHRCCIAGRKVAPDFTHMCIGSVTGHHVKTVGAGGKDYANEVPLCYAAHDTVHWVGRETFEAIYGIDLRAEALRYAKLWDEREGK